MAVGTYKATDIVAVLFLSVPIVVLVPISVPIYTKNDTENRYIVKSVHSFGL